MLEGRDLTKRYGRRKVVHGVTVNVKKGEIVGLLGPNGAGKTTTFYMLTGLVPPNQGTVWLNEKNITRVPVYRRARLGIGYLAQEPSAFRKLTVEENLHLVLEILGKRKRERHEIARTLLEEMGIWGLRRHRGYQLSGGERRRLEIARALATDPSFLLLDEPFTGVDPIAIQELQEIIAKLRADRGVGLLVTDHNVRETLAICDRVYILYLGKIMISGSAPEVAADPIAKQYYLGQKFVVPDELKRRAEAELVGEGNGEGARPPDAPPPTEPPAPVEPP